MKLFRKILLIILTLIVIIVSILLLSGYSYYQKALKETPLITKIEEVTSSENFIKYDDLSKNYINAVIATEDHRYYTHGAIDIIGIFRAFYTNIRDWNFDEGGSTITQQVAKNVILTQEKSLIRKVAEIFAAFDLEKNYTKNEIFELYVNTSYFGDGYTGIYAASMGYYNKHPKDLDLNESSMLAGVPNAPSVYAPTVNPELAKKRQTHVLNKMLEYGYISETEKNSIK